MEDKKALEAKIEDASIGSLSKGIDLIKKFIEGGGKLGRAILEAAGITPRQARDAGFKVALPRFVKGDHFYMGISYKRVNGKWKVKK